MIFVIMNYGVNRNQAGRSWRTKAAAFLVGATVASTLVGASLGLIGLAVPDGFHRTMIAAMAIGAATIGTAQLAGASRGVPQRNCETGQLWMNTGALTGALLNGAALGSGFVTRVGYWLWYAIPLSALLAGPLKGAMIFGVYGVVRGAAPGVAIWQMMLRRSCEHKDITHVQEWLIRKSRVAYTAANVGLLAAAVFAATEVLHG